ncbi:hypothetical protein M426DRAFT_318106 [Hypoxylon sp. CI-4A]|nr:hypothetical protein M426DRAFT_318106 [Hypoxylon sp. CI-4A]
MATVEVFAMGNNGPQQIKHIWEQNNKIMNLGMKGKRFGRPATPEDGPAVESLLKKGRMHLQWLDTIEMTPEINEKASVKKMLEIVLNNPKLFYPEDMKEAAQKLHSKWESDNWGANAVAEDEVITTDPESLNPVPETAMTVNETPIVQSELPPRNHPIYGENGIMHGVMMIRGPSGKRTYRLNDEIPKRTFKVYGHNEIPVGAWFPYQIVALQRGAHGSSGGGISGSTLLGAYSVVVAGIYDDLDDDRGDVLYYSGSKSHDNEDRSRPAPSSTGTKSLKASLRTGYPVRVLRAGGPTAPKGNRYLPSCGLRYDGLYRVVSLQERRNRKGGLYERFQLRRETGQTPLEEIIYTSPTPQQKRDLAALQQEY